MFLHLREQYTISFLSGENVASHTGHSLALSEDPYNVYSTNDIFKPRQFILILPANQLFAQSIIKAVNNLINKPSRIKLVFDNLINLLLNLWLRFFYALIKNKLSLRLIAIIIIAENILQRQIINTLS